MIETDIDNDDYIFWLRDVGEICTAELGATTNVKHSRLNTEMITRGVFTLFSLLSMMSLMTINATINSHKKM